MNVNLFFNHYFNFLSVKSEANNNEKKTHTQRKTQFNKSRGVRISWKTKMWHMIKHGWIILRIIPFEQYFKSFWNYVVIFQYLGFLMNFRDFRVFVFGYRALNEHQEKFGSEKRKYMWICFLIIILTFWVLKLK